MCYFKIKLASFATEKNCYLLGDPLMFNCFENKLALPVFCSVNRVGLLRFVIGCKILEGLLLLRVISCSKWGLGLFD